YERHDTKTPLGTASTNLLNDQVVLNTILRAGLPLQRGISQILDAAELSFVGAARKPETAAGVEIELSYAATPRLEGKVLVMADIMVATGKSLVTTYQALTSHYGTPARTIIVGVIGSEPGVKYVQEQLPDAALILCAIDPKLDHNYFIVPGLGDAGDLLFGPKAL
ncbi:MAG TPA: uracil phosphoribosyltransferase, partial [Candidatus Saccharimonadia bacterium]|nr:uracil phosphoribosyltransferase [Candidatus Saccharimonadia bacterium]